MTGKKAYSLFETRSLRSFTFWNRFIHRQWNS